MHILGLLCTYYFSFSLLCIFFGSGSIRLASRPATMKTWCIRLALRLFVLKDGFGLFKVVSRGFLCWRCCCLESSPCMRLKLNCVSCWQLQIKSNRTYLQKQIDRLNQARDRNMQKNPSYEKQAEWENPDSESSSRIRKLGPRKPKQKHLSYKRSSSIRKTGLQNLKAQAEKPELRKLKPNWKTRTAKAQAETPKLRKLKLIWKLRLQKPKQEHPSHESSSRIRKTGLQKPNRKARAKKVQAK